MDLVGMLLGGNGGGAEARSSAASNTGITFGNLGATSSGGSSWLPWVIAGAGALLILFFLALRR